MKNPKIFIVNSGFYFFGNEIESKRPGFLEFNQGAIFRGFSDGKGLPGVCRGDNEMSVELDRFIETESILLPEINVIGVVDTIDLYKWKNTTQNNQGLSGDCTHSMVALNGGFYFFGKLSYLNNDYFQLSDASMSGGFQNNGISGQCSGNPTSVMTLDRLDKDQVLTFKITSLLAVFPSVNLYKLKTTVLR